MKGTAAAMLALIALALVMNTTQAITCGDLAGMIRPCVGYLQSGGSPTKECCDGARRIQGATQSQADRRTACNCAKSAAGQFKVRQDAASNLPSKCGISSPIPINPNVNCNSIP